MAPLAGLREQLYTEMLTHVKQTDVSVPYRDGAGGTTPAPRRGCSTPSTAESRRTPPGQMRTPRNKSSWTATNWRKGHAFFSVGATDITDDGRWLAYTVDMTGFRQYTLHIKDLKPARPARQVERVGSVVWAADNRTLFYTVEDEEQKRQYQLCRHMRGTPHAATYSFTRTTMSASTSAPAVRATANFSSWNRPATPPPNRGCCAADDPEGKFAVICPREDEHEYSIDHRNGLWYIRTNDKGAISAWSPRPSRRRGASTGPSSFRIALT